MTNATCSNGRVIRSYNVSMGLDVRAVRLTAFDRISERCDVFGWIDTSGWKRCA